MKPGIGNESSPAEDQTTEDQAGLASRRGGMSRRNFLGLSAGAAALLAGRSPVGSLANKSWNAKKSASINILDDDTNHVFLKGGITQFEKQTGINVASYEQLNSAEMIARYPTLFAAHSSAVDVIQSWAGASSAYGSQGWIQQIPEPDLPADLLPGPLTAVLWAGKHYGIPKFGSVQTFFYNKQMFAKAGLDPDSPPTNWTEMVSAAEKMTDAKAGIYGFVNDMGDTEGAYQNFLKALLLEGGVMWDSNYTIKFNSREGVDGLTKLVDLYRVQKAADPGGLGITNSEDMNPLFANGTAAMLANWPFCYSDASKTIGPKNIGVTVIPGITVRSASIDGSEAFAINAFSNEKSAALEWLKFAASPYIQRRMVIEESWLPVTSTLLHEPDLIKALPVIPAYEEQSKYPIQRYAAPWYDEVCEEYLGSAVTTAMLGQASPKDALDSVVSESQQVIDTYLGR
jgi:multiple sugar transport system substrate-binding protein